jgi:hypothetical protein
MSIGRALLVLASVARPVCAQALHAAADLQSSCTPARCDVDGNGTVSVSDGVNILRGAAGLSFTANCP